MPVSFESLSALLNHGFDTVIDVYAIGQSPDFDPALLPEVRASGMCVGTLPPTASSCGRSTAGAALSSAGVSAVFTESSTAPPGATDLDETQDAKGEAPTASAGGMWHSSS